MRRELEDLHLGIVRGEQLLAAVVAVEVGGERRQEEVHVTRNEKSPSCCQRRRGMGQLGFRIESERGMRRRRRADLEREEDGEGGEEEDAEVVLPHLGGGEELQ